MSNNTTIYPAPSYMPDGSGPVPDLLTEEEAIIFLRLDKDGPADPHKTLKYYRDHGLIKAAQVGKRNRYLKTELLRFLQQRTDGKAA